MTTTSRSDVYYDTYDVAINADPYPVYRRLREEAPVYYNDTHDFFAVSHYADVEKGLLDAQTYISGKGGIIELIKADIEMPPGVIIFEDPPTHTIHRRLLSRAFTPRRVAELEPKIREFCATSLDPLRGTDHFDFIADLGARMPMQVISMPMTRIGISRLRASIRSNRGWPTRGSRQRAQNSRIFGSSSATRRGVKARESRRRWMVWVGGSSKMITPGGISMSALISSMIPPLPEM